MGRSIRLVVVALVAALAVAACGGKEETPGPSAAPDASTPTVTGAIGTRNKGRRLELDLASLERMRRVRLEAAEPFLKRRVVFEGVLLSDLLAVAGVPDSAGRVSLTALGRLRGRLQAGRRAQLRSPNYFVLKKSPWCGRLTSSFKRLLGLLEWSNSERMRSIPCAATDGAMMLRTTNPQHSLWEAILPDACLGLPAELARVDRLLDDPVFLAPLTGHFDPRIGRPSIPLDT